MNKLWNKIKNKAFSISIGTLSFIGVGVVLFIIYAYINNLDIFKLLVSGQAFFIYMVILIVGLLIATEIWKRKILGDDDDDEY
jgi:hypothetical protein